MAKIAYVQQVKFTTKRRELLDKIRQIVENYQEQGYRMTLRQLYYQLVAQDVIPNQKSEYSKLSALLTDARMMGLIDWEFIEDRIRVPRVPAMWDGVPSIIDACVQQYRRDRWADQDNYVEVWVEKDALSGVLSPVTEEYGVRLLVNRGYSSATAMHDSALRFRRAARSGKKCVLLYLGDHDPSGEDMVRDIQNRLDIFGADVDVRKIALTREQIDEYQPPPNPAKTTDPRSAEYIEEHGDESWELDALPPNVLDQLLRDNVEGLLNREKFDAVLAREEQEKERLQNFADNFEDQEQDE